MNPVDGRVYVRSSGSVVGPDAVFTVLQRNSSMPGGYHIVTSFPGRWMMNEIRYLASTYFHPDYDLEAATPLGVVVKYKESEGVVTISNLRREIIQLLAGRIEEESLAVMWLKTAGASYDPRSDGLTLRAWFSEIVNLLDQ